MQQQTDEQSLRVVIVDDERLAIRGMTMLLEDYPDINIVGNATCVKSAENLINKTTPDLVFLDIQLQGENGFDLLPKIETDSKVVFVTAFDKYAIRAFEVNALDYLLKPVSHERLKSTISRFYADDNTISVHNQEYTYSDLISLNTGGSFRFIKACDIISIKAVGDYTNVSWAGGNSELVYRTMKEWEKRLPEEYFARVHRSFIVNMQYIEKIEPSTSNRFAIHLHHSTSPIFMSQRYSARFRKLHRRHSKI